MNTDKSPVTIDRALMRAFFALALAAVVLVGALSFFQFRRSLQAEIAGQLQFGAGAVLQRIDAFLFERMENIRIWHRLEVMQDIRVDDVDKRLSRFLSDLQKGHGGIYAALLCTRADGRIVAASDPALIGGTQAREPAWIEVPATSSDDPLALEPLKHEGATTVALRIAVTDDFGKGELGSFFVVLRWDEITALLDDAVANSARGALLLDAGGHVIAASANLRARPDIDGLDLSGWIAPAQDAPEIRAGGRLGYASLLVGDAVSSGYHHFPGFGWHLLMVEPTRVAFAPIWHLLWGMVALLLLTLLAARWASSRLARRIAQPIVGLTEFTRRYRRGEQTRPANTPALSAEVDELTRAFTALIEALERSREQIVRAGKLAVVGEMAAVMAHEVRTPVGILRSSAQLLERQSDLGERERELVGYIISESDRLSRLVTLLLECASPRAPSFRPHDVHAVAEHVLDLLDSRARDKGVELQRELAASESILLCDPEQLTQVFLNLVINALHFVPSGGHVRIASRNQAGALVVSVADDGPGIPAELRQRVFDPFFTRREGGIGLGLTVVQQIVNAHGGDIRVTQAPDGGACFVMTFNLIPGEDAG